MFGRLKEAFKKSIAIFSRKAEEAVAAEPDDSEINPVKKAELQSDEKIKPEKEKKAPSAVPREAQRAPVGNVSTTPHSYSTQESATKNVKKKDIDTPPATAQRVEDKPVAAVIQQPELPVQSEQKSFFGRIFGGKSKQSEDKQLSAVSVDSHHDEKPPKEKTATGTVISTKEQPMEQHETKGFFARAKEALTTTKLTDEKFEEFFWDMELALLENNVAVEVVHKIKADLKARLLGRPLPRDLQAIVHDSLHNSIDDILGNKSIDLTTLAEGGKPFIIAFFGINGSGKTTTIAKVAKLLGNHNFSLVMAAGDTFRAAAIQQLEEHAEKLGVRLIKHDYGADAAAVAFDAVKYAQKNAVDVVLIDTAGRLHSDTNLMDELKKIVRVTKPNLKLFVGESITGNDCIEQARKFDEEIGIDAVILTKGDVDDKGGTALSIRYVTGKPIIYIGTGQRYDDLQPFTKELVLNNLGLTG